MSGVPAETRPGDVAGLDDAAVVKAADWIQSGEAGGEDNRRFCELLHRARKATP